MDCSGAEGDRGCSLVGKSDIVRSKPIENSYLFAIRYSVPRTGNGDSQQRAEYKIQNEDV